MDPGEYCAVLIYRQGNPGRELAYDSRKGNLELCGDFFEDSEPVRFGDYNGNGFPEILLQEYAFASNPPALVIIEYSSSGYRLLFHKCIGGFEFRDLDQDGELELLGSVGATTGSGSGIGSGGIEAVFKFNGQRYVFSEELTRKMHEERLSVAQAEFSGKRDRLSLIFLLSICADLGKAQLGRQLIQDNADLLGEDLDYISHEFDSELEEDRRSREEAMSE